jgi:hypothetical protein
MEHITIQDIFNSLPDDLKPSIKSFCRHETYYIDEVARHSWDELYDMLDDMVTIRFKHNINMEEIIKMFDAISQYKFFEETIEDGVSTEDRIKRKEMFQLTKWFYYDCDYVYYTNDEGIQRRRKRWGWMDDETNYDCLLQDMINTLGCFDKWFYSSYSGSIEDTQLLESINAIYMWIFDIHENLSEDCHEEIHYIKMMEKYAINGNIRNMMTAIVNERSTIPTSMFIELLTIFDHIVNVHSYVEIETSPFYRDLDTVEINQRFQPDKWFNDEETFDSTTVKYSQLIDEIITTLLELDIWFEDKKDDSTDHIELIQCINRIYTWIETVYENLPDNKNN